MLLLRGQDGIHAEEEAREDQPLRARLTPAVAGGDVPPKRHPNRKDKP